MADTQLLIASPDERLGRDLAHRLADRCLLRVTTQLRHASLLLRETPADLALLDLRAANPEASDALLTQLQSTFPDTRWVTLGGGLPVDDPAFVSPDARLVRLSGQESYEAIFAQLDALLLAESEVSIAAESTETISDLEDARPTTVPRDPGGQSFGEVVFEGLSRRFETRSPELKRMLDDLMVAAAHDVTILLIGETGAGKTFLSSLIHESSPRRKEPFLHVACGALPRELLESELFGHVKGAFTSAHADKDGKFLAARRGTILLDEIDVLGPDQQVKLLRVIETGEFEPVGSNQTFRSQARLVVASNLELQPLVEQGRFRPDLYYRLNMMKFEIPPLRKRKVDIIPLAKKFINIYQQKHSVQIHRIEDSVLDVLLGYPWPGNVRELEHVIQRAVIYCRNGVLTRDQMPPQLLSGHVGPTNDPSVRLSQLRLDGDHSLEQQVALSEKEIIEQALFKNNFSRTKTSKELGISRVTLYNKMKKYELLK